MAWHTVWNWLAARARGGAPRRGGWPDHGDVGTAFGLDASLAPEPPAPRPPVRVAGARLHDTARRQRSGSE